MWTLACALLLLCCIRPAPAQSNDGMRQTVWDDPITFNTKDKDLCTMIVTGQGDYTRLRLSCRSNRHSYWCEYRGKPHTCRSYNKNPRHYFVQIMWDLRKLPNACQAPRVIKPHMCRTATEESQMVFSSSSYSSSWSESSRTESTPETQPPARPQPQTAPTDSTEQLIIPPSVESSHQTSPLAAQAAESYPDRIARQYCWRSLEGFCAYVISLFKN